MDHGEWMVVVIVAIVMCARVYRDKHGISRPSRRDRFGAGVPAPNAADDAENRRLRDEVRSLKDRIQVLERIATDSASSLDREIESLRDRP